MKKINLRDYYPYYKNDELIEVPDEVADLLQNLKRREAAYNLRTYRHKGYYSLDLDDGIECNSIVLLMQPSPDEILERDRLNKMLYKGILSLPEKQRNRLYAYYYLDMNIADIAKAEGVNKSQITRSINKALRNLKKFLEKVL